VGLGVTIAPALAAWALVGPSLATMLTSTEAVIITPVSCVAVSHYAVATALLLILTSAYKSCNRRDARSTQPR
jgi:hypothetical protein